MSRKPAESARLMVELHAVALSDLIQLPATVADEAPESQWRSVVLHWTLLGSLVGTALILIAGLLTDRVGAAMMVYGVVLAVACAAFTLHRLGRRALAASLASYGFFVTATVHVALSGGQHVSATADYVIVILLAGFFRGKRIAISVALLACVAMFSIIWAVDENLWTPVPGYALGTPALIECGVIFAITAIIVFLALRSIEDAFQTIHTRGERARELESQLSSARRLEAIGRLAGGVAHDFNNVLTVVVGNAELLRTAEELGPMQRACAADICDASESARRMIAQLMAIGRKRVRTRKHVAMVDSVQATLEVVRSLLPTSVEVRREYMVASDDSHVHIDPSELEQIVINLVANARDAMPDGGCLTVRVRALVPATSVGVGSRRCIELTVTDTGSGMPAEVKERAFEVFFTTKSSDQGSGLGLATVHAIVGDHEGRTSIESTPGRGTSVHVQLPWVPPPAVSVPRQFEASYVPQLEGLGRLVYVIEDEASVRNILTMMMERAGFEVRAFESAEAALESMAQPDAVVPLVVLSDVVMPGMGGFEFRTRLAAMYPELPVLLVSGNAEPERVARLVQPVAHLSKPFQRDELLAAVAALLERCSSPVWAADAADMGA